MNLSLNKAHYPVTMLGFGRRIGLWFQGCSIGCSSCCSQDTWAFDSDRNIEIDSLIDWCKEVSVKGLDGITISGGEPFDQPEPLLALLQQLNTWRERLDRDVDILVYTGYSEKFIKDKYLRHLTYIDALVVGPFNEKYGDDKVYCGSNNQYIIIPSALGTIRYGADQLTKWNSGIQMTVDSEGIWMIGIPKQRDLEKLEKLCETRGLSLDQPSWRA